MMSSLLFPLAMAVATAIALAGTVLYLHYRLVRMTELLARTANQVDTFAEASVALGDAVQRWLDGGLSSTAGLANAPLEHSSASASRRLLLQQAQQQLTQGVPVQEVADYCGLSQDEVRLLSCLDGGQHLASA